MSALKNLRNFSLFEATGFIKLLDFLVFYKKINNMKIKTNKFTILLLFAFGLFSCHFLARLNLFFDKVPKN